MADAVEYKRPSEDFDYTFDFSDRLAASESVDSVVNGSDVTAKDSSGTTVTSIIGTKTPSGQTLKVHLQAGTDLEDYLVTFHAKATTSGDEHEKVLELRVRTEITGGF